MYSALIDVRTLCLGLLSRGDATGYEIKKAFEDGAIGSVMDASYGAIYPALTRLTEEGLATCRVESQDGRPDKKVYAITEAGKAGLAKALEAQPAPDRYRSEFCFFMLFAHLLPAQRVKDMIDDKLAEYRRERRVAQEAYDQAFLPGERFVAAYGLSVFDTIIGFLEANRGLLENPQDTQSPAATDLSQSTGNLETRNARSAP